MKINEEKIIFKVTIIGSFFDLILGIAKIIIGKFFHSHSLIVDGFHSLSDLLTDFFVILVSKYSNEEPDIEHPYGHQRIETFGTLIVGSLLFATAGAFFYENLMALIKNEPQQIPGDLVLWAAFASVVIKEILYQYTFYWGKKIKSNILKVNAWHSRTDAISSVVVLVGAYLAKMNIDKIDYIAAIIVAILIGKVGFDFMKESFKQLTDEGLSKEKVEAAYQLINETDGVIGSHNLRSRWMGNHLYADVNIEVSPDLTVSEGHQIATWVGKRLIDHMPYIYDVTVHTDIEDDLEKHIHEQDVKLTPLRSEILKLLGESIKEKDLLRRAKHINLKYIKGKVEFILFYNELNEDEIKTIKIQWPEVLKQYKWFLNIRIMIEK